MPSQNKAVPEDGEEESKHFDWDGNALNRHQWAKYLSKARVQTRSARFRQHVEFGFHMSDSPQLSPSCSWHPRARCGVATPHTVLMIKNCTNDPERLTAVSRISRFATFSRGAPAGERDSAKQSMCDTEHA
jgi:hypothetical protein